MARPPIRGPRAVSLPLARDGGPEADADREGVDAAKHTLHRRPNGMDRLLGDCETVARFTSDDAPARSRLEGALGSELASRLVGALSARPARVAF